MPKEDLIFIKSAYLIASNALDRGCMQLPDTFYAAVAGQVKRYLNEINFDTSSKEYAHLTFEQRKTADLIFEMMCALDETLNTYGFNKTTALLEIRGVGMVLCGLLDEIEAESRMENLNLVD